jgi:hypothetical protein
MTTGSTESQTIILEHSGANDPTTEGFGSAGTGQAGGVINDLGYNAWVTPWAYRSSRGYGDSINNIADVDWILSVTVRIAATNTDPGIFSASVDTGASSSPFFGLHFGSDSSGNPIVATGGASGIQYNYTLTDAGSTYNNYQLVYDAGTETANLWVNGTEELSGIAGRFGSTSASFGWGGNSSYQTSGTSQANWSLVSLEITPEPSTGCLILFGGGVIIYVRRNYKRRCHQ